MTDHWTRRQARTPERGTIFVLNETKDRLVVRRKTWTKPGFKNQESSGWVIEVDGAEYGPAHPTATAAMRHTELPGVSVALARLLLANAVPVAQPDDDEDGETEEILRDVVVAQTMEWVERGADPTDLAGVLKAAGDLRAWMQAHSAE